MSYIPDFVETTPVCSVCAAVFLLLLCGAALQDYRTREVTNGIWLMAMIFWVPYALGGTGARFPADAVIFWGLQEWFFCRFYGRADCHAFSSCGFYLWGLGCGLEVYLIHMLVSLMLLGMCELCKGNVDERGNLRTPVPFLPYILLGFCGTLAWIWG